MTSTVQRPTGPGFKTAQLPIPTIPAPKPTLASLHDTVTKLRQVVNTITGQNGVAGQGAPTAQNQTNTQEQPGGSFSPISVTHSTQRLYLNNDTSQGFIDVPYISQLVMGNNATASTWTYNEKRASLPATAGASGGSGVAS
jgi:hypothetical protein